MFAARNMLFTSLSASSYDADAQAWFDAVVAAGSSISTANKQVVSDFVAGCKMDGIWSAIKACCLLAGPDDLTGALVPLVGTAPTNNNFVSGDYSRTTGLLGDGSTKYLDSNRANNADPQDDYHAATWVSNLQTVGFYMNANNNTNGNVTLRTVNNFVACRQVSPTTQTGSRLNFTGVSRASSADYTTRIASADYTKTSTSSTPSSQTMKIFARGDGGAPSNGRQAFYSIGESLDLALLDARLTTYMAALT